MGIRLNNLYKSFEGECKIAGLSYEFPESGVVAVVGESGVGKTTLARIICGLDKEFTGEVIGGGVGSVGYAFQEYRLFPHLSAFENVLIANFEKPEEADKIRAKELLLSLGFSEKETSLKPKALSGGMKQRVSLARAFLSKYPVLILDEATKELDSSLKIKVLNIIKEHAKQRLIILITHDMSEAQYLDANILKLEKPRL